LRNSYAIPVTAVIFLFCFGTPSACCVANIGRMNTEHGSGSAKKLILTLSILAVAALIATTVAFAGHEPGAAVAAQPRVTSTTQVTHDGVSKTDLLADESNLYITEWPGSHRLIVRVTPPSFNRSVIPSTLAGLHGMDASPDHAKLLVSAAQPDSNENGFWTLSLKGGSPERLGTITGRDASWSSDGKRLAFGKGPKLFAAEGDGGHATELFTASGAVFAARFSPDGQHIRFTVGDVGANKTSLWEVRADGSKPRQLLTDWTYSASACCGSWTADGRYYIFQATQSTPTVTTTLWALPEHGKGASDVVALTQGPISFGNASPAGDNKTIWALGVQPKGEAVKYDASTKKFVPLVSGVSATDLDFTKNGKWVTYVSIPEGALWRARANGEEKLQLSSPQERTALPHWSPDGKRIAYVSMVPGEPSKISIVPVDGGTAEPIARDNHNQVDANWSQDGSKIMFGCYVHDSTELNIQIVDLKTHELKKIPGSDGLFSPRWSPDGRYIAALSPDFTTVMLFDFESGKWSKWLTEPAGAVSYPVWSSDSKSIYFDDLVTDEESIRSVNVGSSEVKRVVGIDGIARYPGMFGLWAGRTAGGSWMFVRDRSSQEVYKLAVNLP
jgi:Tol biopolymer transport system component